MLTDGRALVCFLECCKLAFVKSAGLRMALPRLCGAALPQNFGYVALVTVDASKSETGRDLEIENVSGGVTVRRPRHQMNLM